jgi:hypothetical protein
MLDQRLGCSPDTGNPTSKPTRVRPSTPGEHQVARDGEDEESFAVTRLREWRTVKIERPSRRDRKARHTQAAIRFRTVAAIDVEDELAVVVHIIDIDVVDDGPRSGGWPPPPTDSIRERQECGDEQDTTRGS